MKRVFLIIGMATLLSCSTEEDTFYTDCKCGTISNDGITGADYWIEVRNDCSGNKKRVVMDRDLWFDAHIGEMRCYSQEW